MRSYSTNTLDALQQRVLKRRNFVWITAPRISDRVVQSFGMWDDKGKISAPYIDVDDNTTKTRDYVGTGSLVAIDNIPLVSDITVRNITVKASHIQQDIVDFVRGYDLHKAPIEIHRGMFKPGTWQLRDPAYPRFVGFIDKPEILDAKQGGDGQITLNCVSHTRMLTRINSAVRSGASQRKRNPSDTFYDDTPNAGNWQIFWGEKDGTTS